MSLTPGGAAVLSALCRGCPLRRRCTRSKDGRTLRLHPHDTELVELRRAWREGCFAVDYRRFRPMVESSIAWLVAEGWRRCRYGGVAANQLGLSVRWVPSTFAGGQPGLTSKRGRRRLQPA